MTGLEDPTFQRVHFWNAPEFALLAARKAITDLRQLNPSQVRRSDYFWGPLFGALTTGGPILFGARAYCSPDRHAVVHLRPVRSGPGRIAQFVAGAATAVAGSQLAQPLMSLAKTVPGALANLAVAMGILSLGTYHVLRSMPFRSKLLFNPASYAIAQAEGNLFYASGFVADRPQAGLRLARSLLVEADATQTSVITTPESAELDRLYERLDFAPVLSDRGDSRWMVRNPRGTEKTSEAGELSL